MSLSQELTRRGFIHQTTAPHLSELLDGAPQTIYHGIDPSADSAHAGNMVVWLLLRHLAVAGHRIIFLVGGGTGLIGDPKPDAERVLKTEAEIDANVATLQRQAVAFVGQGQQITFVNNKEWLGNLSLLGFLRDIGKHFTVNELIKKEAIAKRIASDVGITYTEFAYPLLQGYDYLVLHERYGCTIQVGGSDQWGNIVAGVDLVRRKTGATVHALTVPLVVDKTTGKKFGKSEGNAIWLQAKKTSPFQFYQFWLNVSDDNVADYLKLFTFLPLSTIDEVMQAHHDNPSARTAQKTLARAVTILVHGDRLATAVEQASEVLFGETNITSLTPAEQTVLLQDVPTYTVATKTELTDLMVATQLATSKREAREFIVHGAVSLAGETVVDVTMRVAPSLTLRVLKRGKKHVVVLR